MTDGETTAAPPEALAEARAYLRVDGTGEDAVIGSLVAAALAVAEAFGGAALLARTVEETLPRHATWTRLARTPVREIVGVDDADGVALPAEAYAVEIDVDGDGWVRPAAEDASAVVRVRYRAGLAESWGGLPAPLRQGVVRLAAHLYAHRGETGDAAPPAAVTALWRPFRRMRLGGVRHRSAR